MYADKSGSVTKNTAMSECQRVEQWFMQGALVRPRAAGVPTSADLIRAVAHLCGVPKLKLSAHAQHLAGQIGQARHYVLVIVDGLGIELLLRTLQFGFLLEHLKGRLEAVFPSTTGAAMTTLATGAYPAEHAVPGWWVWIDEHQVSAVSLPFIDRMSGRDLMSFNVKPQTVFTVPSLLARMKRSVAVVTLRDFVNSVYSDYTAGGCRRVGYDIIDEGVDAVLRVLDEARGPTFTQFYLPQLDAACHTGGVDCSAVGNLLRTIDRKLARLRGSLPAYSRLIITADHGHVNLPGERNLSLRDGDPLLDELTCPPSGEPAVPMFHVRPGRDRHFEKSFRSRFGEFFALLSTDEVEQMRLLGPRRLTPLARRRFGDYLGIAPQPAALGYVPPGFAQPHHLGIHAGLSSGEMFVPLVLV
jgi:hypothetical protein